MVIQLESGRFAKDCPECGEQQTYLRKNYAEASLREGKACKSCTNRKTENSGRGIHRGVNVTWFNKFKNSAALRGLVWAIGLDDVADVYEAQSGLCALSGWQIGWSDVGQIHTASIVRIDSDFGYTADNIQIVHKVINMMKQQYSQKDFIEACVAVADKVKW